MFHIRNPQISCPTIREKKSSNGIEKQWELCQEDHSFVGKEESILKGVMHRFSHPGIQSKKTSLKSV